jgi:TolB-like protein
MEKRYLKTALAAVIFIFTVLLFLPASSDEGAKKVAILPFNMNADRDLKFLQEGILDMLASRLAWKDRVEIMGKGVVRAEASKVKGPLDLEKSVAVGKALNADYVILGSLTVFGKSVSIDAKIISVSDAQQLITAFNQSKGMDEVIPTINQFGQDINAKIMGRPIRAPVQYTTGYPAGERGQGLISVRERFEAGEVGRIETVTGDIVSIDVGDVDGDGKNELVAVDEDTVYVYKRVKDVLTKFRQMTPKWSPYFVHVNVADMDGDGKAEIYVSNLPADSVASFVLEWDGKKFRKIADNERWLFNIVNLPGKGTSLIGQKRVSGAGLRDTVYRLKMEKGDISDIESLDDLPPMANVFNFARVNLTGKQGGETIVLSPASEILFMYDSEGEEMWTSDEEFGGLDTHIASPGSQGSEHWVHFSPPILLTDVDANGVPEVVIAKNFSPVGRLTNKDRFFNSGELHFLTWDELTLSTRFKTPKMPGPITSYCIKDVDNDKKPELIMSVVTRKSGMEIIRGKSAKSKIVIYDLDIEK